MTAVEDTVEVLEEAQGARAGHPGFLKVLSFNMQVGIETHRPRHYVTRSMGHVLPSRRRMAQLDRIAGLMAGFDLVGLQEADAGSFRTRGDDQVRYLCDRAGHDHHSFLLNRNYGRIAQHGIALTGRRAPVAVEQYALPGRVRGRGAIFAEFAMTSGRLTVVVTHLALVRRDRDRQTAWLAQHLRGASPAILMGDFNCSIEELIDGPLGRLGLCSMEEEAARRELRPHTYPSWNPQRAIDHVLVSPDIGFRRMWIPEGGMSDHLPVAAELLLPAPLA